MKWTELHDRLADFALSELHNGGADYQSVYFQALFNNEKITFTGNDQIFALDRLHQMGLIERSRPTSLSCKLTLLGMEVMEEFGSFSNYVSHLKEEQDLAKEKALKEERIERAKGHLVYLQIAKHWLTLLTLAASIATNIYFYFDLNKVKDKLETKQTTITDTIQQPKSITLKGR
jgi:hypothetical protein